MSAGKKTTDPEPELATEPEESEPTKPGPRPLICDDPGSVCDDPGCVVS